MMCGYLRCLFYLALFGEAGPRPDRRGRPMPLFISDEPLSLAIVKDQCQSVDLELYLPQIHRTPLFLPLVQSSNRSKSLFLRSLDWMICSYFLAT
ncbi:hypothetical protein BDV26DRAFT_165231 [Aspergillus bertholletiae]|uniref:Secreted protein n=1 Tax=Aspergillus bertholletiae TaxID=1226010 RepID=A0A5N7BCL6_9EURO|nr:hypothetical protein BDV26DRAFT_165231 [Aspergillus bertholletiae]